MNNRVCFLSFADSRMSAALERIKSQAKQMGVFDEVIVLNESDLDIDFRERWKHVLQSGVRGFGYWCWKPYIILKVLEKLSKGDILMYCDAGCHLNPDGVNRLVEYFEELKTDKLGIKAFEAYYSLIDVKERRWTKGSVFDYFKCRNLSSVYDTPQVAATQVIVKKCECSDSFVQEWYNSLCCDFSLIDDSPSITKNFSGYIESRHDQSLFSVLFKLRGGVPFPPGETELILGKDKTKLPIWNIRDRGYKDTRFLSRLKRWVKSRRMVTKIKFIRLKEAIMNFISKK